MNKHLIYLASGNSRRFGSNKLLTPFQGQPLYLYGLRQLMEAAREDDECTITVVSQYSEIRNMAEQLGLRAVDCPDSVRGMSYSVKAGIEAVSPCSAEDFLMFACADQPHLCAESVRKLLQKAIPGTETARLSWGDSPGNPVLFSANLIPELLQLQGDQGGGAVIRRHSCIHVPAGDPRELKDIDCAEDMHGSTDL